MTDNVPKVETLDRATLLNARLVFQTMLHAVLNMDFIPEEKNGYTKEIQKEIDAIDVELLSRGGI